MKKIVMLLVASLMAVYIACDGSESDFTVIYYYGSSVMDGNYEELGSLLSADEKELSVLSPDDTVYSLDWMGNIDRMGGTVYYASNDCSGMPLLESSSFAVDLPFKRFVIRVNTTMFRIVTDDSHVVEDSNLITTDIGSLNRDGELCTASSMTDAEAFELEEITNTDLGIPGTIAVPILIE